MGKFDALCHLDVHEMTPQNIKALREEAHVSQAVFAAVLNTNVSTVQKWEVGDTRVTAAAWVTGSASATCSATLT
jgi:putative transcriptional regulator